MINNNKYNELFPKEINEDDPLNQQDFDVVSYINKIFPHGNFENLFIYNKLLTAFIIDLFFFNIII